MKILDGNNCQQRQRDTSRIRYETHKLTAKRATSWEMAPNTFPIDDTNLDAQEENLIAILALVTLLIFFFAYCCWGTSWCENISSRLNFCRRVNAEPSDGGRRTDVDQPSNNPTIILLPHGRILVVDGSVFARFHANNTGLDLFELGDSVLRDERPPGTRSPSFVEIDSETTAKDCSSPTASPLPPTYESIFGGYQFTTPPPYSEALRVEDRSNRRRDNEEIERESTL